MIAVPPFVPGDPAPLLARYRKPLRGLMDSYEGAGQGLTVRDRAEITSWFDGLDLVAPGVVPIPDWRPDGTGGPFADPARFGGYGAVGRVP